MAGTIVVGTQWGDEGKGKVVDVLASRVRHVARGQGGNNAGHTLVVGGEEHKVHLIPSGVLHANVQCYLGAGMVIDPEVLLKEIALFGGLEGRLWISPRAHLITAEHRERDRATDAVGTTGRGIGPCYADRALRVGVPIGTDGRFSRYFAPVSQRLDSALEAGEDVLLEGAQGTFLDLTFGTYPFVTSSSTLAAGICAGVGLGPRHVDTVVGVVKSYSTRVGLGPMPTEFGPDILNALEAREVGVTTGRLRRLGWLDVVMLRAAVRLNGLSRLALTKLDILDTLPVIKICVGYRIAGKELAELPSLAHDWERVEPIYEEVKGWQETTSNATDFGGLPAQARAYVERIEELARVPIDLVSVGPERGQTILRGKFWK